MYYGTTKQAIFYIKIDIYYTNLKKIKLKNMKYLKLFEDINFNDEDWEEELEDNELEEDRDLIPIVYGSGNKYIGDGWYLEDFPDKELVSKVINYLNKKLKIVYSEEANPENPFVASYILRGLRTSTINIDKVLNEGSVELRETPDGKQFYMFYFDSDTYRFEAYVYVSGNGVFFTDYEGAPPEKRAIEIFDKYPI